MSLYPTLLLLSALVCGVTGNAAGANSAACTSSSMTPNHYGAVAQSGAFPYTISLSASNYSLGGSVNVKIQGTNTFKGFLVLALPENELTGSAVGTFAMLQNSGTAISQDACTGGATHTSSFGTLNRTSIELTWTAPTTSGSVNVVFYVTIVQQYNTFYVKKPSSVLTFASAAGSSTTAAAGSSTTAAVGSSTTAAVGSSTTAAVGSSTTTAASTQSDAKTTISASTTPQSALALIVFSALMWLMLKTY